MKKILKSVILITIITMLLFILTGCANVNYEVKLDKNGSGEISYIMGYDKSFLTSMQVSIDDIKQDNTFDEMKQEATKEGYTVDIYEDDNTYGFRAYKHVDNIQNEFKISQNSEENDGIKYEKSFLKIKFWQDAKLNLSKIAGDNSEDALTSAVLNQMKISYKLVLPFKAGQNNANTVSEDGKTLEWTLKAGQINEIKFVAEQTNIVIIAILAIGLIIILVIIFMIMKMSKRKDGKQKVVKNENIDQLKKEEVNNNAKEQTENKTQETQQSIETESKENNKEE